MRTPMTLIVLILFLQALAVVEAAEKKIVGKISAVDAGNRSITVDSVTLDVIRKTKITVEGESARFANVMVGQSANVTYDDELEFATLIAIRQSPAKDEVKTAADMKFLQGNWIGIAEEGAQGEVFNDEMVRERDRRVTIARNNFTMTRTLDGKRGSFTGKFDIDAATGQFDFIGKDANGHLSEWIGVYEIKDDTWRVRYNFKTSNKAARPATFDSQEGAKSSSRTYTFKRDVD
ncbi:MAG: hypothetical protein JWP89_4636 [Schlesneria sp.]|nr:hypothetical protein [Schlesneria sp.]